MDPTTMALLTGLLGTAIGAVLIGGSLLAAYLVGKERGRRERDVDERQVDAGRSEQLQYLERSIEALRLDVASLRDAGRRLPESSRQPLPEPTHRTPH